jgi:hypothetical protein
MNNTNNNRWFAFSLSPHLVFLSFGFVDWNDLKPPGLQPRSLQLTNMVDERLSRVQATQYDAEAALWKHQTGLNTLEVSSKLSP